MYVCMYVCVYIYIYIYTYLIKYNTDRESGSKCTPKSAARVRWIARELRSRRGKRVSSCVLGCPSESVRLLDHTEKTRLR